VVEPPESVVFTVLISLIILILTIPIVVFLDILLENYACTWPGNDDSQYDPPKTEIRSFERKAKPKLREIANESIFGEVINKAVTDGSAYDSYTAADLAQLAYSGLIIITCFDFLRKKLWTIVYYSTSIET
jgi:hypothetical protein